MSSGTVQQTHSATCNLRILAFVKRLVRALRMRTGKGGEVAKASAMFFLPLPKDSFISFPILLLQLLCVCGKFFFMSPSALHMANIQNI